MSIILKQRISGLMGACSWKISCISALRENELKCKSQHAPIVRLSLIDMSPWIYHRPNCHRASQVDPANLWWHFTKGQVYNWILPWVGFVIDLSPWPVIFATWGKINWTHTSSPTPFWIRGWGAWLRTQRLYSKHRVPRIFCFLIPKAAVLTGRPPGPAMIAEGHL